MPDSFPPPGFISTESAVSGITVYMPAPPVEAHREVVAFKCPRCAAHTAYSIADGGLTCTHCGYYEPPAKAVVGKGAADFEFTVDVVERAAHGWGVARKELICQNCGARTSVPADSLTHPCPFCASNRVIQQVAPQDALRPRFLAPFRLEQPAVREIARQWLGSSWMTPASLRRAADRAEFRAVYIPYWTFDAKADSRWRAEVGRERRDSDGDTVIKWRWESGGTTTIFDDVLVPGTTRVSHRLLEEIRPFDLDQLAPYEAAYLAGFQAQAYETPLDDAWQQARHQIREHSREACRRQALADRDAKKLRSFSMSLDFAEEAWRYILLPIYIAAYNHDGRPYQAVVNGQSGAIAGQRPADWRRVLLALAGLLIPGPLVFLLIALWIDYIPEAAATLACLLAGVWMLAGLAGTIVILSTAVRLDDA